MTMSLKALRHILRGLEGRRAMFEIFLSTPGMSDDQIADLSNEVDYLKDLHLGMCKRLREAEERREGAVDL